MAAKSLGTPICTLSKFQSFIAPLNIIPSAKLHFGNNELLIHSTESSNCAFVILKYKAPITTPLSIAIDLATIKGIKSDDIQLYTKDNMLIFHDDGLSYKCASLSDPNVDRRDREGPEIKWEHIKLQLTTAHIKKILTMLNAKNKYNFKYTDGLLEITDATDNATEYQVEIEGAGTYFTQLHGMYLIDIFMAPKHFDGCTIILGNNTPFSITYACEWLDLQYFIAQMIDQD